jgi:hypothetical protein
VEFHLPDALRGARLVLLDEWIGGRSAFELHAVLKAAVEAKGMLFGMFAASPGDGTVFAAWAAGFDLFLDRDTLNEAEFTRLLQMVVRRHLQAE